MSDHVYKLIEISGTSRQSMENVLSNAIAKVGPSLKNIRWFEVTNI
ncbi:MAG: dodecin family protein [Pseudomonadota bacterium]